MQPYLTFDGNAAAALDFYCRCLGGQRTFSMTFADSPMAKDLPAAAQQRLMHGNMSARGFQLMASDTMPGQPFDGHKGFSLSVNSNDVAEGERLFKALSEGGQVTMPYGPTFWAAGFGMLVDQFGVPWMVNVEVPQSHG